jgi:hypothetical protein
MNQSHTELHNKNLEYDNELNKRLENRNVPSVLLQPIYDIRPVATKYTIFHTDDKNQNYNQNQNQYYDPHQVFNPGKAPIDYFIKNIDIESTLRSQFFALQQSPQSVYIPELNSQLYQNDMAYLNPPDSFSTTDATTQCSPQSQNEFQTQSVFYNCIKSNSKK